MHPVYLSKVLLAPMLARDKKSAIVITSSACSVVPLPGCATYSAAKSCAGFLGVALSYELEGRIDVLSADLAEVSTKDLMAKPGGRIATTEEAVNGMLRDLGRERRTFGCFRFEAF